VRYERAARPIALAAARAAGEDVGQATAVRGDPSCEGWYDRRRYRGSPLPAHTDCAAARCGRRGGTDGRRPMLPAGAAASHARRTRPGAARSGGAPRPGEPGRMGARGEGRGAHGRILTCASSPFRPAGSRPVPRRRRLPPPCPLGRPYDGGFGRTPARPSPGRRPARSVGYSCRPSPEPRAPSARAPAAASGPHVPHLPS